VYKRNASTLVEALKVDFPNFAYTLNETKPRSGSFEITLSKQNENPILIWTGLKLKPRKEKFISCT